jgi:hypothetical protein
MWSEWRIDPTLATIGNVEKSHQQRSRHFVVLTYWKYAPRVKIAAAFPSTGSGQDWMTFLIIPVGYWH